MTYKTNGFFRQIIPFIGMGIFLVLVVIAFMLLSYLLLIGGIVGLIIFGIVYIKDKFFTKRKTEIAIRDEHKGRTYEHKDHD